MFKSVSETPTWPLLSGRFLGPGFFSSDFSLGLIVCTGVGVSGFKLELGPSSHPNIPAVSLLLFFNKLFFYLSSGRGRGSERSPYLNVTYFRIFLFVLSDSPGVLAAFQIEGSESKLSWF
jgi:hypothetical protein